MLLMCHQPHETHTSVKNRHSGFNGRIPDVTIQCFWFYSKTKRQYTNFCIQSQATYHNQEILLTKSEAKFYMAYCIEQKIKRSCVYTDSILYSFGPSPNLKYFMLFTWTYQMQKNLLQQLLSKCSIFQDLVIYQMTRHYCLIIGQCHRLRPIIRQ